MDLRRLLNIVYAHLTREVPADKLDEFVTDILRVKFDHEMTHEERKRVAYRRKLRELGMTDGTSALMDAFRLQAAG